MQDTSSNTARSPGALTALSSPGDGVAVPERKPLRWGRHRATAIVRGLRALAASQSPTACPSADAPPEAIKCTACGDVTSVWSSRRGRSGLGTCRACSSPPAPSATPATRENFSGDGDDARGDTVDEAPATPEDSDVDAASLGSPSYLNGAPAVKVYEHSVEAIRPADEDSNYNPDPPTRGAVTSFSRASRRRMLKKMMKVQSSKLNDPLFITLTWHNNWSQDHDFVQRKLNTFLQAVRRKYPDYAYIWRLEFQKRGAPHIHLILWTLAGSDPLRVEDVDEWCVETWHRIAEEESEHHKKHGIDVRECNSWRHARSYVSKYCAKVEEYPEVEYEGRRWGASRSLPTEAAVTFHVDLDWIHQLRRIMRKMVTKQQGHSRGFPQALKRDQTYHVAIPLDTMLRLVDCLEDDVGSPDPERHIRDGPSPAARRRRRRLREAGEERRYGIKPRPRRAKKSSASTGATPATREKIDDAPPAPSGNATSAPF